MLGGWNEKFSKIDKFLQYLLYDIIGRDTFYRFMIDLKQVRFF